MVFVVASIISKSLFNVLLLASRKKAIIITSVHKKNFKFNMDYCRSIAILPILSCVFKRLFSVQLRVFLEANKLLSSYQHGFRISRSCQTALISLTNILFTARGDKTFSATETLSFLKA